MRVSVVRSLGGALVAAAVTALLVVSLLVLSPRVLSASVLSPLGGSAVRPADAADAVPHDDCRAACHRAKSLAYQRCRAIAPSDRERRGRCFRQADLALERCLARCG